MTCMAYVGLTRSLQVREAWETARRARLEGFMAGFTAISHKLKEMYQMITLGGDAELELVDSLDPFSEVRKLCTAANESCSVPSQAELMSAVRQCKMHTA